MPGVLICESIFQTGAILLSSIIGDISEGTPVLTRISNAKFKNMVRPGAILELEAELEQLKNELVSSAELTRAKNQILRDFLLARQNLQTRAEELGYAVVVLRDPQLVNTELDRFLAVAAADIQRVARKYFVPENVTIVEVFPKRGAAALGTPLK